VAKSLDSRRAKLESVKVEGPSHEKRLRFRFPEPPHCGRTVLTVGRSREVHGARRSSPTSRSRRRGEHADPRLNGAGKTTLLRI
jgi:ATPase subunit of ABC transporter with duplicated ATPase domains